MEDFTPLKMSVIEDLIHEQKSSKRAVSMDIGLSHTGLNKIIARGSMETKVLIALARKFKIHPCDLLYKMLPSETHEEFTSPALRSVAEPASSYGFVELSDKDLLDFLKTNKSALDRILNK